jgi:hypothetical protein
MKRIFLLTATLILPLWIFTIINAQAQPNKEQILQACAGNQMQTLPMPFSDVPANHWAYDHVMKMYYCGVYRGDIAAAELQRLQAQNSNNREIALNTLLSAPETVEIAGRQYSLETFLWRDFMPPASAENSQMLASIKIIANDNQPFPNNLNAGQMWVVAENGEVWQTTLVDEGATSASNQIERMARNGPNWETGTSVDVIIQLTDSQNQTYLIRAPQQTIIKTQ